MTINGNISNTILSNQALLEKVDKLRDLNIGQHVPLPQLVVVGDQSSGKSSLLESLTGIPFLRDQSLCTRYATQITSRRDAKSRVDISIIAGANAKRKHKTNVESFQVHMTSALQLREKFAEILQQANEKMGLSTDICTRNGPIFSHDILKIEVYGPNEDYLTIIDVPGIFRNTTEGTTKEDISLVRGLIKSYMKQESAIILAVLPSNVDIATQEILDLAEEYDKNGRRTLGILTKPDLVHESSAKTALCELVKGKRRVLNLGYFLVRNRGQHDDPMEQAELDKMFSSQPWADLPSGRVGIAALKKQLGTLLLDMTEREFPKLIRDVSAGVKECEKELNALGPRRQNEREQRSFLVRIAAHFQHLARVALEANYNANPVFDKGMFRLITNVVSITDVFNADFRQTAHSREFDSLTPSKSSSSLNEYFDDSDEVYCANDPDAPLIDDLRELLKKSKVDDISSEELDELGDVAFISRMVFGPTEKFNTWISQVYLQFRGLDLGTFNANLLPMAFAEQSRNWDDMTRIYMSRVIITIHRFIRSTLQFVCPDEQIFNQLWSALVESLVDCYRTAISQATLLIEVERRQNPYTLNKHFNKALARARVYRLTELLRRKAKKAGESSTGSQYPVNLADIPDIAKGKSNMDQLQDEVHDILQAYYNLAVDRFIDNVLQLAVDHCLLHGPQSPLKIFNQDWVSDLEPKLLERIAGERNLSQKGRVQLEQKKVDLTNALEILKA